MAETEKTEKVEKKADKFYCSNCREDVTEKIRKQGIGSNRYLVFCNYCNCFIRLMEPVKKK